MDLVWRSWLGTACSRLPWAKGFTPLTGAFPSDGLRPRVEPRPRTNRGRASRILLDCFTSLRSVRHERRRSMGITYRYDKSRLAAPQFAALPHVSEVPEGFRKQGIIAVRNSLGLTIRWKTRKAATAVTC